MPSQIKAIEFALPTSRCTNEDLLALAPGWTAQQIEAKTGILCRHVSRPDERASDLAVQAAVRLFSLHGIAPQEIDYLLYCTQSPDYLLPTTACLLQQRLGLSTSVGAIDINQGCSGYIYALGLAKGLVETSQAGKVLLLTADTYTKLLHPEDRACRTLFGDGASATLVERVTDEASAVAAGQGEIGPFHYGTDGRGAQTLIVRQSPHLAAMITPAIEPQTSSGHFGPEFLYMDGAKIFEFAISAVPTAIRAALAAAELAIGQIDLFVFHQANAFMLEHLRRKLNIPPERFEVCLRDCGNTVSSSIPIALCQAYQAGRLHPGSRVMLVGFGVGLSWGTALLRWSSLASAGKCLAEGW